MNKTISLFVTLITAGTTLSCMKISGSATAKGPVLGDWSVVLDKCVTGDRERFLGAYLQNSKNPNTTVKIVKDAMRGVILMVTIPATCKSDGVCQAAVITREMCAKLQADVFHTSVVSSDDYRAADGHLFAECTVTSGAQKSTFTASVRFENCQ